MTYKYCGTTQEYCGAGCQAGCPVPTSSPSSSSSSSSTTSSTTGPPPTYVMEREGRRGERWIEGDRGEGERIEREEGDLCYM